MRRFLLLILLLLACSQEPPAPTEEHNHHHHPAPHGGTLIVFGSELAHLELVLDPDTGELTGYLLDGAAENGVRLRNASLELEIEGRLVVLQPVADPLTGETTEKTSQFSVRDETLKGISEFHGKVKMVEIKGQRFENTEFHFPEGNEHH